MTERIRLHYFHGRGIGEPVRLLLTVGGIKFDDLRYGLDEFAAMPSLAALGRVIAPGLIGHGDSDDPPAGEGPGRHALELNHGQRVPATA